MAEQNNFVRSALTGPTGEVSTARLCTLLLTVLSLSWVTFLVVRNKQIPDLTNLSVFMCTQNASLYGMNKITAAMAARKCDQ